MKVNKINFENFRGYNKLNIDSNGESLVFFGKNGSGKTTILDGVATLLARFVRSINRLGNDRSVSDSDITHKKVRSKISIQVSYHEKELNWEITKKRRDSSHLSGNLDVQYISDYVNYVIDENYENDGIVGVPVTIYYPVNRVVLDIPIRTRKKHDFSMQDIAFERALTSGADFRTFFEWYRNREDLENETKIREGLDYKDTQLEAVRNAIYKFLPDFSNLRISRSPLRMLIDKGGLTLEVSQLSDGEKCLLAMVGDLARRLALANPGLINPLHGEGIVLIDEIELHLHPGWQRKVISGFFNVFPKIQFIITTHSPQVISEVKNTKLFVLEYTEKGSSVEEMRSVFGQDVNFVLEEVMEAPRRNESIQTLITDLFRKIEENDWESVDDIKSKLESMVDYDEIPELIRADMVIRRRRGRLIDEAY